MTPEAADRLETVGRSASIALEQIRHHVHEQISATLKTTIDMYERNDLTEIQALAKIAEMHGLRNLLDTLETQKLRGQDAIRRQHNAT